jgi:hypothetical protein
VPSERQRFDERLRPAASTPPASTPPSGHVLGASKPPASKPLRALSHVAAPTGSVLGAAHTLGTATPLAAPAAHGTLPFTGMRVWIIELVALALIGGGVALRLIARRRTTS